jgi:hypothetical protein
MDPAQRPIDPELEDCRIECAALQRERDQLLSYIHSPAAGDPFTALVARDYFDPPLSQ